MKQKYIKIILLVLLLVVFDQIVKFLVVTKIGNSSIVIIRNFLEFSYIKNTGAAFGFLSGRTILLVIITLIFMCYIIKELKKNINDKLLILSFILIISGSLGNLIDRIRVGYVIDFISFILFGIGMPIFNVADIFITFGILIYIYKLVKEEIKWKE